MSDSDIDAIAALRDPVRRSLYDYVVGQGREVSRNEAAEGVGVQRTLAAFHLDRLVEAGLLETGSGRLNGRSGPGAGRPAKLYRRAAAERAVSLPARDYRTAAELLAEAAEAARLDRELEEAARRHGRSLREEGDTGAVSGLDDAARVLAARGYEPVRDETGRLIMRNCPFHVLSERFPPLVCGMNLALLDGLLEGAGGLRVRMDARPGRCCVVVEKSKTNRS
jgi:predicted ArsR family transcriptional regulator